MWKKPAQCELVEVMDTAGGSSTTQRTEPIGLMHTTLWIATQCLSQRFMSVDVGFIQGPAAAANDVVYF